jgi:acetoin utilization deacetylase AcuC-like enzyme
VVAALAVYREQGVRCAWVDLDGHFGNSIQDSREFAPDLDRAIPLNINPGGRGEAYLGDLVKKLEWLEQCLLFGHVDYVCFAHGADSHEWDDLRGQLSTEQWLRAAECVYLAVYRASCRLGRPVPVVMSLFGGYREDDLASVLELHLADLAVSLRMLGGARVSYQPAVQRPARALKGRPA